MYNPFSLSGKTVLITGASSGIGRATAIECSQLGAKVIINGRDKDKLQETFCRLTGSDHLILSADLTDSSQLNDLINSIPIINGVVHCAGITKSSLFQFVDKEDIEEIMQINFFVPAIMTQKIIAGKKIAKGASIVFVSSVSGIYSSFLTGSIYSASKGAINGLLKGMAIDLAVKEIRVNSVNPAMIETNIHVNTPISKEHIEKDKKRYPLKRYGTPEEVAYAIIYLLSDAASWITGTGIIIDGGFTTQ